MTGFRINMLLMVLDNPTISCMNFVVTTWVFLNPYIFVENGIIKQQIINISWMVDYLVDLFKITWILCVKRKEPVFLFFVLLALSPSSSLIFIWRAKPSCCFFALRIWEPGLHCINKAWKCQTLEIFFMIMNKWGCSRHVSLWQFIKILKNFKG